MRTALVYPVRSDGVQPHFASAELASGSRDVRVVLAGLPFGVAGPSARCHHSAIRGGDRGVSAGASQAPASAAFLGQAADVGARVKDR